VSEHTIPHPGDQAICFASHKGSICAPKSWPQAEVEAAAATLAEARHGPWRAVDKSQPPLSIPPATPGPCQQDRNRLHWFLISGELP
jgi:hypothetical protein